MKENNVVWHDGYINRSDRNNLNEHKSGLVWFTGLSGSGKSTIAHLVEKELYHKNIRSYVFDGDNVRHGLNRDLGFSPEHRKENIRRIIEMSKLFIDAGLIVLAAFISPDRYYRQHIRQSFENDNYIEVYVKCSIETCEKRDPKGQYKKARAGIIKNYTGVSAPYEEPANPDIIVDTEITDIKSSVQSVLAILMKMEFLSL